MEFTEAFLLAKLGHPELAGWWGKLLGGGGEKSWEEMTWADVVAATKSGKYKSFEVGATKDISIGPFGTMTMQIVGIDADDKADGTGKAPLSFLTKGCFSKADYPMTSGTNVYWPDSIYHNFLVTDVFPELPQIIKDNIKSVIKYTYTKIGSSLQNNIESVETIWAPSVHEIFTTNTQFESAGPTYSDVFTDDAKRVKRDSAGPQNWYLRTAASVNALKCVRYTGALGSPTGSTTAYCAVMGFCL